MAGEWGVLVVSSCALIQLELGSQQQEHEGQHSSQQKYAADVQAVVILCDSSNLDSEPHMGTASHSQLTPGATVS
jgi:hypothetical protein